LAHEKHLNRLCFPELALKLSSIFAVGTSGDSDFEIALLTGTAVMMERANSAIANGTTVVCDRSWVSNLAFARTRRHFSPHLRFDPELHGQQDIIFTRMYPTLERRTTLLSIEVPADISSRRWAQRTPKQVEPGHTPTLEWFKVALRRGILPHGVTGRAGGDSRWYATNFRHQNRNSTAYQHAGVGMYMTRRRITT
jgi:hypothetical protein